MLCFACVTQLPHTIRPLWQEIRNLRNDLFGCDARCVSTTADIGFKAVSPVDTHLLIDDPEPGLSVGKRHAVFLLASEMRVQLGYVGEGDR